VMVRVPRFEEGDDHPRVEDGQAHSRRMSSR
jgi:hypothetical protein